MIAPKRRLTNHALHGREEWFKRIFRDQIAEAAGILEVVLSGIVLAALLMSIVPLVELMPGLLTDADSATVTGRADPIKRITDLEAAVASIN